MVARREAMGVEAEAGAVFRAAGEHAFRQVEILRIGELGVDLFAGHARDPDAGEFRQRHIVGDGDVRMSAMGGEDGLEMEGLRRLRPEQAFARHGRPDAVRSLALERVGHRQQAAPRRRPRLRARRSASR